MGPVAAPAATAEQATALVPELWGQALGPGLGPLAVLVRLLLCQSPALDETVQLLLKPLVPDFRGGLVKRILDLRFVQSKDPGDPCGEAFQW